MLQATEFADKLPGGVSEIKRGLLKITPSICLEQLNEKGEEIKLLSLVLYIWSVFQIPKKCQNGKGSGHKCLMIWLTQIVL